MRDIVTDNLEFPEVRVVEASAGSGKTYTLAKRYLQLLLNERASPENIRTILAITFTNMAAREMKERILEFLKKIALNRFSNPSEEEELLSSLTLDKQASRTQANALMDYIIRNYNFFQVQTIDSFINIILSGCAYRMGLSANFKIKKNYQDFLYHSLDKSIDEASYDEHIREIFYNFLDQYIYVEEKKSWFPKKDIFNLISSLLYHSNVFGGEYKKFNLNSQTLKAEKKSILKLLNKLKEELPEGTDARFKKSLIRLLEKNKAGFDFKNINYQAFIKKKFPINKGYSIAPKFSKLWENVCARVSKLAEKEACSLFNCYIDVFQLVYKLFRKYASFEDVLFLEELNSQAMQVFKAEDNIVPELYYRLATRFQHYLIDEFQDTSILQWQNLFFLIEDALSSAGSLFYVGDKKQAIYRFRGGDVSLFDKIKQELRVFNVRTYHLNSNYRSQKEIVEFNNIVFSQDNLSRFLNELSQNSERDVEKLSKEDINEITAVFKDSKQVPKDENCYGYVKVETFQIGNKEEAKEKVKAKFLAVISELKARFSLKDIAVLSRRNQEVELLSSWLIENNIAVESDKTLDIRNNHLIKEMISFLKFLNSPINNLSFISFILGEIFVNATGINKVDLVNFVLKHREKISQPKPYYIYRAFRYSYPEVWNSYIEEFFKRIGFVGLYELVIDILQVFKVFQNFRNYQGFFMHLLELIKEKEEEYISIKDFLDYFENSDEDVFYVYSSDTDAVKVMTIHKAKGLGFPVVVIPFLDLDVEVGARSKKGRVPYVVSSRDDGLTLMRLDKKYARLSNLIREAYRREYKKSFIDELNTIYVAFTRAGYELYIFIPYEPSKKGKTKNPTLLLIPPQLYHKGKKRCYLISKSQEDTLPYPIPDSRYENWIDYLKEEFKDTKTIRNRKELLKGEVLHYILSFIGNLKGIDKDALIEKAFTWAKISYPFILDFSEIKSIIIRLLGSSKLKNFFYLEDAYVYQEKEIVGIQAETKRIDRLIIKQDEIWVIDYKSSGETHLESRLQVLEYLTLVRDLYPDKKVKGYLIFLDDLHIEEIDV